MHDRRDAPSVPPPQAPTSSAHTTPSARGRLREIFVAFLRLGLTSFGGPAAHLGYFREELVLRRRWIDESGYASLLTLCQFLPGPASTKLCFALGLLRGGGLAGGIAAWAAFSLPSVLLMLAFAFGAGAFTGALAQGCLHGLKLVAVAIVAHAVWGMARSLVPDLPRAALMLIAAALAIAIGGTAGQVLGLLLGALGGLLCCRDAGQRPPAQIPVPVSRRRGGIALAIFAVLLVALPIAASLGESLALQRADAFYRAGALVFGGGHVVLPLLQEGVVTPGWVDEQAFLAGYGVAQAIPGPLFTFAAYLGAVAQPAPSGFAGAMLAVVAIFLPGLLLVYGALPFWDRLGRPAPAQAAVRGTNAAVVGILAAALIGPIRQGAIHAPLDVWLALAGFALLMFARAPAWVVVALLATAGALLGVATA